MNAHPLDTQKAADYLGIKPSTLKQYRWANKGPAFYKIGARCVYDLADLEAFKRACRVEPASESAAAA